MLPAFGRRGKQIALRNRSSNIVKLFAGMKLPLNKRDKIPDILRGWDGIAKVF